MRRGREVSLFGARAQAWPGHAHNNSAPGAVALRILRRVADDVLARELVGNLTVDARQIRELRGEERTAARFLRELPQHELGFLEALARVPAVLFAQADGVDRRVGAFGEVQHLFEVQQTRGVLAVRAHADLVTT